jgi:hypothetical protein
MSLAFNNRVILRKSRPTFTNFGKVKHFLRFYRHYVIKQNVYCLDVFRCLTTRTKNFVTNAHTVYKHVSAFFSTVSCNHSWASLLRQVTVTSIPSLLFQRCKTFASVTLLPLQKHKTIVPVFCYRSK